MERKRTDSWEEVRSGTGSFVSGLSIYGGGRRKSRVEIIDNIGKDNEVKAKISYSGKDNFKARCESIEIHSERRLQERTGDA